MEQEEINPIEIFLHFVLKDTAEVDLFLSQAKKLEGFKTNFWVGVKEDVK